MAGAPPPPRPPKSDGPGLASPMILALFLVLVGFFAFLVSISEFEGGKRQAVMRSVAERFAVDLERIAQGPVSGDTGQAAGQSSAAESMARLFKRALKAKQVKVLRAGDRLQITTPQAALFKAKGAELRKRRQGLIERVAASLKTSAQGKGAGYGVQLVMADPSYRPARAKPADAVAGLRLSSRRGAALAEALRGAGAPQAGLSVSLAPSEGDRLVRWRFRARSGRADAPLLAVEGS